MRTVNVNDENLWNHATKKYEKNILEQKIIYTFIKCFQRNFRTHTRNDFGSQSLGIKIQQNNKTFLDFSAFLLNFLVILLSFNTQTLRTEMIASMCPKLFLKTFYESIDDFLLENIFFIFFG